MSVKGQVNQSHFETYDDIRDLLSMPEGQANLILRQCQNFQLFRAFVKDRSCDAIKY